MISLTLTPLDPLRRKLGRAAWAVWCYLLPMRDCLGQTHSTTPGLAASLGRSPGSVKRAFRRLRRAGLVRDVGWQVSPVFHDRAERCPLLGEFREVYAREVLGALAGETQVCVPETTTTWLVVAVGHGGKRDGAGRPVSGAPKRIKMPPRHIDVERITQLLGLSDPEARGNTALPAEVVPEIPMGDPWVVGGAEASFTGGGLREPPTSEVLHALPPFPAMHFIKPAMIPPPPMLPGDTLDDDRDVEILRSAFASTHARRVGGFAPGTRGALTTRSHARLVKASVALREVGVAPLVWADFAFGMWATARAANPKPSAPHGRHARSRSVPIAYVWNAATIVEHGAWCRADHDTRGATTVLTRSHRTLIARWQSMMHDVNRGVSAFGAVAQHFPGGLYLRLVESARAEALAEQTHINARIAAGDDLWHRTPRST